MLAQNFKSAADLGITEAQKDALIKTLVLLETGKLSHCQEDPIAFDDRNFVPFDKRKFSGNFNMRSWNVVHDCGSVCCIGGTAELVGNLPVTSLDDTASRNEHLYRLFYPKNPGIAYADITTEQAARALRSYLTTGDPRWDLACA